MKIYNTTTNKIVNLIHPYYDVCPMADITSSDPSFGWDEEREVRTADQDTIDWWIAWADADAKAMWCLKDAKGEVPADERPDLQDIYNSAYATGEMEDGPESARKAVVSFMDEAGFDYDEVFNWFVKRDA